MNKLKELREKKGLTLKQLSDALKENNVNISPDSLAKYERGERKPKYDKWVGIAKFYGVPVPYLQGLTISEDDAVNTLVKWLNGSLDYSNFNMQKMIYDWLIKVGESKKSILQAIKDLDIAKDLIIKCFPFITNPVFLAKFTKDDLNNGVFENKIAGIIGNSDDKAISTIYSTKFSDDEDQNFKIQGALESIITDIYIDLIEKEHKLDQRITKIENILSKLEKWLRAIHPL